MGTMTTRSGRRHSKESHLSSGETTDVAQPCVMRVLPRQLVELSAI